MLFSLKNTVFTVFSFITQNGVVSVSPFWWYHPAHCGGGNYGIKNVSATFFFFLKRKKGLGSRLLNVQTCPSVFLSDDLPDQ